MTPVSMSSEKTKVYIVDDHPLFRRGVRDVIELEPRFQVVGEAGDGEVALQEIKKLKPSVALVDLQMPRLGGLQLVRSLRDLNPSIAVIVLTMQNEESMFNAAMDAGAQEYILKENAVEDVVLGLKTVAGGGIYLSPSIAGYLLERTRRASSSRSMRFHSKNRSQSAVSEPTRLSVPFEAMSSALNTNSAGMPFCGCL